MSKQNKNRNQQGQQNQQQNQSQQNQKTISRTADIFSLSRWVCLSALLIFIYLLKISEWVQSGRLGGPPHLWRRAQGWTKVSALVNSVSFIS